MNKEKISIIGVLVNIVLAVSKLTIGAISKSSAVMAEGVHSAVDILSSALNLFGVKKSKKPVDKEHPYGHYKFEVLSGLLITLILSATGIYIIYRAYKGFMAPTPIEVNFLVLGIMAFSAAANEIMSRYKISIGKKEKSISLISDGIHSRLDVISSLAVFIGLFLAPLFVYADAFLTLFIGLYILKESYSLGKEATDSLLDVSAGEKIESEIKKITEAEKIELSDIKTQKKGYAITANLVIVLPKTLSVDKATEISEDLRKNLMNKIENLIYVAIQIKSHDIESNYYEPLKSLAGIKLGQGYGWSRKGKFEGHISDAKGFGPGGTCICEKCGYIAEHVRGVPCSTIKCPKCKSPMTRGNSLSGVQNDRRA
jgi:cation diffusion facilitator family transporter